jgi:hypothetical protein
MKQVNFFSVLFPSINSLVIIFFLLSIDQKLPIIVLPNNPVNKLIID